MSVLVLDDDVSVVSSLADVLRAERCIVHTATRPSAALGVLRNIKVDAVISDVVMPEMDGYEFYMKVKEELPNLPVILMTAYYYDKDHIIKRSRLRGLEAALFKKPVNPAKLRNLLIRARHKGAGQPGQGAPVYLGKLRLQSSLAERPRAKRVRASRWDPARSRARVIRD